MALNSDTINISEDINSSMDLLCMNCSLNRLNDSILYATEIRIQNTWDWYLWRAATKSTIWYDQHSIITHKQSHTFTFQAHMYVMPEIFRSIFILYWKYSITNSIPFEMIITEADTRYIPNRWLLLNFRWLTFLCVWIILQKIYSREIVSYSLEFNDITSLLIS